MKFILTEQMKHRIVGVIVIVSLASIFLPALMKKSNYRFDETISVAVRLPAHPPAPKVHVVNEKQLFETVKVAKVKLDPLPTAPVLQTVKAQPISQVEVPPAQEMANIDSLVKPAITTVANVKPLEQKPVIAKINPLIKPPLANSIKTGLFAVQLATFSQQKNAEVLVSKLKAKGFQATYYKFTGKQGILFKVLVGEAPRKEEAANLQKQLAQSMNLKGFVVKKGVS